MQRHICAWKHFCMGPHHHWPPAYEVWGRSMSGGHPLGCPPQVKVGQHPWGYLPRSRSGGGAPGVPPRSRSGAPLGVPPSLGQGPEGGHPRGTPQVNVWGGGPRWVPPWTWGVSPGVPPPQNKIWTQIWTTFWKLLEAGGMGGLPLAVMQEDCLVIY